MTVVLLRAQKSISSRMQQAMGPEAPEKQSKITQCQNPEMSEQA